MIDPCHDYNSQDFPFHLEQVKTCCYNQCNARAARASKGITDLLLSHFLWLDTNSPFKKLNYQKMFKHPHYVTARHSFLC